MLKSLNKLSKPTQYVVILALVLFAYLALTAGSSAPSGVATKKPIKKTLSKKAALYTKEDYKAKFEPVSVALKNSFKPLISKAGIGGGKNTNVTVAMNEVPSIFAGGEANWTYTGTVTIDGVREALLENKSSGDSVFLRTGDKWKGMSITSVGEDSVSIIAASGQSATLHLLTDDNTVSPAVAQGFAPVTVNPRGLRGNIGFGNLEIRPDNGSNQNAENGDQNAN